MLPTSTDAAGLRRSLGPRDGAAVGVVTPEGSVSAATVPDDAEFEIGSLSKGVTGLLHVDARERGEVAPDATLGDLLPIDPGPVAALTLASLSTHTSGLPRLPPATQPWRGTLALLRNGRNPYGETVDELLEQTRGVTVGRPRPRYSNFGFALLGHAVAAATDRRYPELVRDRLAEPLGLTSLTAPDEPDALGPRALPGTSRLRRSREPWTGSGIAPAGGLRATLPDLLRLAAALLDGSAPGLAALDPVADLGGPKVRVGAAWVVLEHRGRTVTWHNGMTGGFSSWLGVDREAGTGVVVLRARSVPVEGYGFDLLTQVSS